MLRYLTLIIISLTVYAVSFAGGLLGIVGEDHTSVGIYIKDLKSGEVVLEQDADRCLTPASITKLYTAASAMSLLNEDFRYDTRVYLTGNEKSDGEWLGNIVVKASGDPTLESEHFKDNMGFIQSIIDALKSKGIHHIDGDIILARVDENHQYPEGPVETWNINDVARTYGAGAFDFNWCDNYFGLYPASGKTTSPVDNLKYTVWDKPWSGGLNLIRGVYSDSLIVVGKGYKTDKKAKINTSMPYPFDVFRSRLVSRLNADNITITLKPQQSSYSPNSTLLVSHLSPKLDAILRSLMKRSDNMFAEGILRTLGSEYGNTTANLASEEKLWKKRGLKPQYNRILDGSGLSRANAISPRFFGEVLEWMAQSDYYDRFIDYFPKAGVDGTMRNFMGDTKFKGRLAMKTGSVNAVQCYAGYLTDDDGTATHVVVIMINNFYCTRAELKTALRKLLLEKLK